MSPRTHLRIVGLLGVTGFASVYLAMQNAIVPTILLPMRGDLLLATLGVTFVLCARCLECGHRMTKQITPDHDDRRFEYYWPSCHHADHSGPLTDRD